MTRANNLTYDLLKFMKDKGCWQVRIGIESGEQKVLDFIKKGITIQQVTNAANWCHKLKIKMSGFFMVGHHIDTVETINKTIDYALSIPLTDVIVTINTPIPGTESYLKAREYGTYDDRDITKLNCWNPVFIPHGLTADILMQKQAEFYRRFYLRPRVIMSQMSKITNPKVLFTMMKNAAMGITFLLKSNSNRKKGLAGSLAN